MTISVDRCAVIYVVALEFSRLVVTLVESGVCGPFDDVDNDCMSTLFNNFCRQLMHSLSLYTQFPGMHTQAKA